MTCLGEGSGLVSRDSLIRIALLDDHPVVRCGMSILLSEQPDFVVVGSFETSRSMISGLLNVVVDVLLVDYSLGCAELDGVSLIRTLRVKFPDSRILVFSSHYDPAIVALTLRLGVSGFAGKSEDVSQVFNAIRVVAAGSFYVDACMSFRLAEMSVAAIADANIENGSTGDRLLSGARLSVKEREVIRCFLDGMTVSDIARKFGRSVKTISTQKSMAFRKLGVSSSGELFKIKYKLEEL